MPVQPVLSLLATTPIFLGVDKERLGEILGDGRTEIVTFQTGDYISDPQTFRHSLGIVVKGEVKVIKEAEDGHKVLLNTLHAGHMLGAAALFTNRAKYITSIVAAKRSTIIFFPEEQLADLFIRNSDIAMNYIHFLSGRVYYLNQRIDHFLGASAQQRLHLFLSNQHKEGNAVLHSSMAALAEMLNIGRASLYRAMDQMESEGLIERHGKEIRIMETINAENM